MSPETIMAKSSTGLLSKDVGDHLPSKKNGSLITVSLVPEHPSVHDSDSDGESPSRTDGSARILDGKRLKAQAFDDFAFQQAVILAENDDKNLELIAEDRLTTRSLMAKMEAEEIIKNPREYQMELFERAKAENVISVLPTGSGKTLIAVLLLQHVLNQELESRAIGSPRRVAFFLVEVATLVYQQAAVLERNLSQSVARFCGEMNVDSWSKATWKDHFDNSMVIVMTAEVLNNCLSRGFIKMQEINLLIFDEAHHAKKNHPYARIMRDFYEPATVMERPKIFGTTASPVDAKVDAIKAANALERILHSKIVTVKNYVSLGQIVYPPEELTIFYSRLAKPYETLLCSEIGRTYRHVRAINDMIKECAILTAELGEWCGDRKLLMSLTGEECEKLQRQVERRFANDGVSQVVFDKEMDDIKAAGVLMLENSTIEPQGIPKLAKPYLSDKVLRLKSILDEAYDIVPDTRCIVFVERRSSARLLLEIFNHHRSVQMRPALLIGKRQGETGDQSISIRDQISMLRKFKSGEVNLLFATSVAEEGLDIPLCNLVIRFDLYKTLIQYMQSRGRARHRNSKYIHMLEEGNANHTATLKDIRQQELILKEFCQQQPPDRILEGLDADLDKSAAKFAIGDRYVEKTTGAKLLFGTVLGQLAYFAACIPQTDEIHPQVDYIVSIQENRYVCEVLLPIGSPLRSIIGKPYARKSLAKRSAAFEACLQLRKLGLLDANLLPIYHKQLPFMRNARLALHGKTGNAYELLIKPKFWESGRGFLPCELFVVLIRPDNPEASNHPIAPILMLTRIPLPAIPKFALFVKPGVALNMSFTNGQSCVSVSQMELIALTSFTLRIYKDAFNKVYEDKPAQFSYWLAPVKKLPKQSFKVCSDLIDWETVEFVKQNERIAWTSETPAKALVNRFFVDEWHGGHRYYSIGVDPLLKATDPPPAGVAKKDCMDSIAGWTSSLRRKSRQKLTFDPDQPVLVAYKVPIRRNLLADWNTEELQQKTNAWICPEQLKISALPFPIAVMSFMLPAMIWRIDAYLIAIEGCNSLDLQLPANLALEAMTKDSENTEDHAAQQLHLQRGMGNNYERLEFIGDAFLKMVTSISLFAGNASDDEYQFHVKRMLMICNKNLFSHAVNKKLFQYIRTEGFNRRFWYPEGLVLVEGKGATIKQKELAEAGNGAIKHPLRSHHLNDKTIADVCEALIGASLLSERHSESMDLAVKAVTVLVNNPDHTAKRWDDYHRMYNLPSYQTLDASAAFLDVATRVEMITNYKFKYPRLLISAFTHPSCPSSFQQIPCYQRLEFLGDALLDMACVNHLFHGHPDKDPQWLTEHKMAMVSNKFLGALCVRLQFYKHLRKNSSALIHDIANYVESMEECERDSNGATDYWTDSIDPPKCLPDIVEAYIGAIFVDSSFDYKVVEQFFEKHVRWYFEDMSVYDTFANNHPTTFLGNLLINKFNCSEYDVQVREMPSGHDGSVRIMAGVMIHLKIIAHDQGTGSKYAKVRASKKAIAALEEMSKEEFREKFNCDCNVHGSGKITETEATKPMTGTAI